MSKWRWTVNWTGFAGSPGYSHFITGGVNDGGDTALQLPVIRSFLSAWSADLPDDVALSIEPTQQELDDNTGDIIGTDSRDTGSAIAGTNVGSYSAAGGVVVIWHTGQYRNGREVRGRTFMVPTASSIYSASTGAPSSAKVSSYSTVATDMATDMPGGLFIESGTGIPRFVVVTGGTLSPRAAVLRSRRD